MTDHAGNASLPVKQYKALTMTRTMVTLATGSTALWTLRKSEKKIGVEHEEQIEIADYELPFDLHSDTPLWEINANCHMVLELEGTPIGNEMKTIQQKWFSSFDEFIDHKDEIRYYDVGDGAALAEYLICEEKCFR